MLSQVIKTPSHLEVLNHCLFAQSFLPPSACQEEELGPLLMQSHLGMAQGREHDFQQSLSFLTAK